MSEIWIPRSVDEDLAQYKHAKHERKPHGLVIVNGQEVATTLQCPHCGGHFISMKGSGHRRSFCTRHMAVTCGQPACRAACTDFHPEALQGREV